MLNLHLCISLPVVIRKPGVRALYLAVLFTASGISVADSTRSDLQGVWRCEGSNDAVSFVSDWVLSTSGEYSDTATVHVRQDIDGDARPDALVIDSVETGTWTETDDGNAEFHVLDVDITGLTVNDTIMPIDQARSLLSGMTTEAVGRVLSIEIVARAENTLVAKVSGILTECGR